MCETITDVLCKYRSIRFITIQNKKLAAIYYILLLLVLSYIIGYTIIYSKGYQTTDSVTGVTSVRVKGSASIGNGASVLPLDSMDLRNPPHELDALFITTAMTVTPNQTQTVCNALDDSEYVPSCTHSDRSNCTIDYYAPNSRGIYTGECGSNNRCELFTWCPVENDSRTQIVQNVGNFSLFVKILVSFDRFNVKTTNLYDIEGNGAPVYGYNLFTVNDILSRSTDGKITDYMDIADSGAILMVSSIWNCDFDSSITDCKPTFKFKLLGGESGTISMGFNFHTVSYDVTNKYRLLKKLHGLRIMFVAEGTGTKFNFAALTVTLGAGLAYLGVAKFITDVILDNFMGNQSNRYVEFKYREINDTGDNYDGTSYQQLV